MAKVLVEWLVENCSDYAGGTKWAYRILAATVATFASAIGGDEVPNLDIYTDASGSVVLRQSEHTLTRSISISISTVFNLACDTGFRILRWVPVRALEFPHLTGDLPAFKGGEEGTGGDRGRIRCSI